MNKNFLTFFLVVGLVSAVGAQPEATALTALDEERLDQSGTVVSIIFDDSGSMREDGRMQQAKAAFEAWLAAAPEEHRFGLTALNAGPLIKAERGNKEAVVAAVRQLRPRGGTPLADVIDQTVTAIGIRKQRLPFERHVLLVFTDGADSTDRGAEGVRAALQRARDRTVETVGIGFHGMGDYMQQATTRYFDANDQAQLLEGLQKVDVEIGDTSDLRIAPDVAELMQQVEFSREMETASGTPPEREASPAASSGRGAFDFISLVLILIGVVFVLQRLFRRG